MSPGRADVVVVGAGTAGIPLAIEAAQRGLCVALVEQAQQVGGTLWRSWAQLSAGGTMLQARKGIQDDPDLHFDDVMRISKHTADPALVRLAVDLAPHTVDWLMAEGFDMDPDAPAILHFHEPYLLPRTYWGRRAGRSVLDVLLPLLQAQVDAGAVDLMLGTEMLDLRVEGDRVLGVDVRTPDGARAGIDADAVVLTTGGYAGNAELFPRLTQGAPLVGPGSPTSTGAGIMAAAAAGAQLRGHELFLPTYGGVLRADSTYEALHLDEYPQLTPQARAPWEIHVNSHGRRFVAEDAASVDDRENALLEQPDLAFWVVYDEAVRHEAPALFPSWSSAALEEAFDSHPSFTRADALADLAERAGIDETGLAETVAAYNAAVGSGHDAFGRVHLPRPIAAPPFYAVKNHGTTLKSPAGLAVTDDLRVRRANGTFANLYAAGEALGGSTLSGKSFVSGMSVTPALSFGRMIGRQLAGATKDLQEA